MIGKVPVVLSSEIGISTEIVADGVIVNCRSFSGLLRADFPFCQPHLWLRPFRRMQYHSAVTAIMRSWRYGMVFPPDHRFQRTERENNQLRVIQMRMQ